MLWWWFNPQQPDEPWVHCCFCHKIINLDFSFFGIYKFIYGQTNQLVTFEIVLLKPVDMPRKGLISTLTCWNTLQIKIKPHLMWQCVRLMHHHVGSLVHKLFVCSLFFCYYLKIVRKFSTYFATTPKWRLKIVSFVQAQSTHSLKSFLNTRKRWQNLKTANVSQFGTTVKLNYPINLA